MTKGRPSLKSKPLPKGSKSRSMSGSVNDAKGGKPTKAGKIARKPGASTRY